MQHQRVSLPALCAECWQNLKIKLKDTFSETCLFPLSQLTHPSMDNLSAAVEQLQKLSCDLNQRAHQQRRQQQHHRRRIQQRQHPQVPRLAVHYTPTWPISCNNALQVRRSLEAYSAANQGFPTPFTSDEVTFVIDTGASITVTNCKGDFMAPPKPVQPTKLQGIAAGLEVHGIGDAEYFFTTDSNEIISIVLCNVLYVPGCNVRLLCPRHLAECSGHSTDGFNSIRDVGILTCYQKRITVPYHSGTGLPIITTAAGLDSYTDFCTAFTMLSSSNTQTNPVLHASPARLKQNLTNHQRLKLMLHERCNHRNMKTINQWIRSGYLQVDPAVANSPDPICIACQYGKAHRKPHLSDKGSITARHTSPGDGVSADQLEANYPGKLPTTKGLPTHKRYKYCNIWVDHYSRYIFPTFHETKEAKEMLASKLEFQTFAARYNVKIKSIRADNGAYAFALFKTSCDENQQDLTFNNYLFLYRANMLIGKNMPIHTSVGSGAPRSITIHPLTFTTRVTPLERSRVK
jgi:hypothetical protein